jgi:hypothetical protein
MPYRYIDWLLTTPLLLVEFGLIVAIAGAATKGFVTRIVVADIIMIVTGYLGEVSTNEGSLYNWVMFLISSAAWLYIVWAVFQVKLDGMPDYAANAVKNHAPLRVLRLGDLPNRNFHRGVHEDWWRRRDHGCVSPPLCTSLPTCSTRLASEWLRSPLPRRPKALRFNGGVGASAPAPLAFLGPRSSDRGVTR